MHRVAMDTTKAQTLRMVFGRAGIAAAVIGLSIVACGCTVPKKGPQTAPDQLGALLAAVRDHDGQPVGKDALLGHRSVLWFYPKAQTSG